MWRLGIWFSGGLGSVRFTVGFDNLKGRFQPKWFYDSMKGMILSGLVETKSKGCWGGRASCLPCRQSLGWHSSTGSTDRSHCKQREQGEATGSMSPTVGKLSRPPSWSSPRPHVGWHRRASNGAKGSAVVGQNTWRAGRHRLGARCLLFGSCNSALLL